MEMLNLTDVVGLSYRQKCFIQSILNAASTLEFSVRFAAELPGAMPAHIAELENPHVKNAQSLVELGQQIFERLDPHSSIGQVGIGIGGLSAEHTPKTLSQSKDAFPTPSLESLLLALNLEIRKQPSRRCINCGALR